MKNDERPIFHGYHSTKYNQIVEPRKIWNCSKYFLRRWAPILEANRFWTVIGARHLAYVSGGKTHFRAFDRQFSNESKLSMRQVSRVKGETLEPSALSVFLTAHPTKKALSGGVVRSEQTHYSVRLDTPLTPSDALEVSQWINELRSNAYSTIEEQLSLILESGDPGLLIPTIPQRVDKHLVSWNGYTVSDLFDHANLKQFNLQSDRIHQLLTGSSYVGTQYFRNKWVPLLGPGPAYLISWMRSYCYADDNEYRNEITIEKKGLAQQLYVSVKQLGRWINPLSEYGFLTEVGRSQTSDRKKLITYQVNLFDPLTPKDMVLYKRDEWATGHFGGSKKAKDLASSGHFGGSQPKKEPLPEKSTGQIGGSRSKQKDILAEAQRHFGRRNASSPSEGQIGGSPLMEENQMHESEGQIGGSRSNLTDILAPVTGHNDRGHETNWLTSKNKQVLQTLLKVIPSNDMDGWHLKHLHQPLHTVLSNQKQITTILNKIGIDSNSPKYKEILGTNPDPVSLFGQWLQILSDPNATNSVSLFIHRTLAQKSIQPKYLESAKMIWGDWLCCLTFSLMPVEFQFEHAEFLDFPPYQLWSGLNDPSKNLFGLRTKLQPHVTLLTEVTEQKAELPVPDLDQIWDRISQRLRAGMGNLYDIFLSESKILSWEPIVQIGVLDKTAQSYLSENYLVKVQKLVGEFSGSQCDIEFKIMAHSVESLSPRVSLDVTDSAENIAAAEELWESILAELKLSISKPVYAQTFKNAQVVSVNGDCWQIRLRNQNAVEVANYRLRHEISWLSKELANGIDIEFTCFEL